MRLTSKRHHHRQRVAIIGSGNWGTAIAKLVGENAARYTDDFEKEVRMWVFEEQVDGQPLTQIINDKHENVRYLPGIRLPDNVVAESNLEKTVEGASALIFVIPHQFIEKTCRDLRGKVASYARGISLVKGVDVQEDRIRIYADVIEQTLSLSCCALSGANIANEVAEGAFSETTIGYPPGKRGEGMMWRQLFETDSFRVSIIDDVRGVSLAGALKNVVAVAAGFSDGLGWGNNAKAAIMRIGLLEMKKFSQEFFEGPRRETFVQESAGVADLITSCLGGRNRKCAEAFVKQSKSFEELEREMLNGQKLQGAETARDIHRFLEKRGRVNAYPLFRTVYEISYSGLPPHQLTSHL